MYSFKTYKKAPKSGFEVQLTVNKWKEAKFWNAFRILIVRNWYAVVVRTIFNAINAHKLFLLLIFVMKILNLIYSSLLRFG